MAVEDGNHSEIAGLSQNGSAFGLVKWFQARTDKTPTVKCADISDGTRTSRSVQRTQRVLRGAPNLGTKSTQSRRRPKILEACLFT